MQIAIIGGRHKNASELERTALAAGHQLELHPGEVGGRGADGLRCIVARADLVVILTEINSHGAVAVAKKTARQLGTPTLVLRRIGRARLEALLEALDVRARVA